MVLRPEASPLSKDGLLQLSGTAILYFLQLTFLNSLIVTTFGAELRPSTFVPVVSGLLFGLPAAIGAFLGNFFSVYYFGYGLIPSLAASVLNFLLAYTPYRLWYSWQSKKATLYIYNNRTFIKYIAINFFSGASFALLWFAYQEKFFENSSPEVTLITFVNNFAFPALLGLPIIMLWNKYATIKYYCPQRKPKIWQRPCRFALWLLGLVDVICFFRLQGGGFITHNSALGMAILGTLIWLYAIQTPSSYTTHHEETEGFRSLSVELVLRLFTVMSLLIVVFLLSTILMDGIDLYTWRDIHLWKSFGMKVLISLLLLALSVHRLLRILETTITYRLKNLSSRVKAYLETRDLSKLQTSLSVSNQQNEIDILEQAINKMSSDLIEHLSKLDETVAEQMKATTQLDVANSIQQGVLPQLDLLRPKLHGYRIEGGMTAAKVIGGDMYDAFLIDDDHLVLYVADVAGKGIPAALLSMVTQALFRQNSKRIASADQAMSLTNDALVRHNEQCLFVTVWLATIELSTGHIRYVNAGHNPPLVHLPEADKAVWLEEISGPVLGLMPDLDYTVHQTELPKGASLLLYTDGLNEAEDINHEFFGNNRLEEAFMAAKTPQEIMQSIHIFTKDAAQSDDMTYLWLHREEEAE